MCGSTLGPPDEQSIVFANSLHGQTSDEFKNVLIVQQCNTLLWRLPAGYTDEIQPIDAGYGRLFKVHMSNALDKWLLDPDNVEFWESNKLTASQPRILITQWVGEAAKKIDVETAVEYHRRLFEKTGLAVTADRSNGNPINLQGTEGGFSFMDADCMLEPLKDVLPASPAPADEEHPPGSSDDEDDSEEEGGERNSGANNELATMPGRRR